MRGSKKPSTTAPVRRTNPDLSDADIASVMYRHGHLFGRQRIHVIYDPEGTPFKLKILNEKDLDPTGSYLIYGEETQRFIGIACRGRFHLERSESGERERLVLYPAAQA